MAHTVCTVIIPMYNEELVIEETYKRLKKVMNETEIAYELIFVNDGSRDQTASIVSGIAQSDGQVRLLDFSRNFGHQAAVSAGLDYARGQAVVIIDADLQDPPEVIPQMLEKWRAGFEVVYGKRMKRKGETFFKKLTAYLFYRFLRLMTNEDIPTDTGDFRLMDRKVCDAMKRLNEKNRFLRGLVHWVGFKQAAVSYVRDERWAGETKYPFKKMLKFATDGIVSFTYKPLKLATYLGFLLSISGFLYLIFVLYERIFLGTATSGWASIIGINLIFNGITLIILGIIGEYVGRIYEEVKGRPLYIVREEIGFCGQDDDGEKEV